MVATQPHTLTRIAFMRGVLAHVGFCFGICIHAVALGLWNQFACVCIYIYIYIS